MRLSYGIAWTLFVVCAAFALRLSTSRHIETNLSSAPRALADAVTAPAHASPAVFPDITGQWTGTWLDTIYFAAGDMNVTISTSDGVNFTATGEIDVGSIDLTLGILPGSASGTLAGAVLSGTFTCTNLGNGTFTLTDVGGSVDASGSGTVTAPLNFGAFTFTGTIVGNTMDGTFDFTSPTGGAGTATLIRTSTPVDESTWGEVKALYRDR